MTDTVAAIVLAAGQGKRMNSQLPKVLHKVAGRPMIGHVLHAVSAAGADPVVVVVAPGAERVAEAVAPHRTAVQETALGTGDAARSALEALGPREGTVLIVFGDTPLITANTLERMVARRRDDDAPAVVVLGFETDTPGRYGRLVEDGEGRLFRIVEATDATEAERAITLCNGGIMAVDAKRLPDLLARLEPANAQGEFYLTDIVALAREDGAGAAVVRVDHAETMGVDSRAGLARAEAAMQARLRAAAMEAGVTLVAPDTVYLSADTEIGRDTVIDPHVVIAPGVRIGERAAIRAFSHLEGAVVADGAVVGPYARLRPGAEIGSGAHVGNFVEIKNAALGEGAKANHLSYIGDATVGAAANIGAGTITCNYDGFDKHRTEIGAGAFIGSNSALVAPVTVAAGAIVGAGSTITRSVDADAIAVERAEQKTVTGAAARFRDRKRRDPKT